MVLNWHRWYRYGESDIKAAVVSALYMSPMDSSPRDITEYIEWVTFNPKRGYLIKCANILNVVRDVDYTEGSFSIVLITVDDNKKTSRCFSVNIHPNEYDITSDGWWIFANGHSPVDSGTL